ncbi:queuosine biosynthesis protein QueD [Thalassoporum mexicanum PCC 7367]|uniref:6-carboxytetrahydropterin synthase QueD n=1 Tax=Thalassoporum mexicanum TaxID=3457544 RepID=UPI00029F9DDC|nr:6-carboxytetrahydropterin synthase QueD [Pseudanabaena sp. PCC 7367]AFY71192.1 queuosine biosynthesis protein QueD [Pseudanabaena sp. PCC 7367]
MPEWIVYKEFRFEAAHLLPDHDGKCRRLHGHSWVCLVYVKVGQLIADGPKQGMAIDFADIKKYMQPILDNYLDHYYLNETLGLENPTCEAIARWLYEQLEQAKLPGLHAVEIKETCTSGVWYSADGSLMLPS